MDADRRRARPGVDAMGVVARDDRSPTENDDDRTRATTERARRPTERVVVRRSVPFIPSFMHACIHPRCPLNPKPYGYFPDILRSVGRSPRRAAPRRDALSTPSRHTGYRTHTQRIDRP